MTFAEAEACPGAVAELRKEGVRVGFDGAALAGFIDRPASDHRLLGWALWRFGGDSVRLGNVSYFPKRNAQPLADDPRNEYGNGVGALIYPGTDTTPGSPWASIRLKLLREAAEDYAYLSALAAEGYAAYADELAAGVVPAVPRGRGAIAAAAIYEGREAAALAAVKSRWGQGIAENVVAGRTLSDEGIPVAGAVVRVGPLAAVTGSDGGYELRYVPRGRALAAEAPGYERAGTSGAGGRGDFYLRQILRRFVLNNGGPAAGYEGRGFKDGGVVSDGNPVGGPAYAGRLEAGRGARFAFRPPLRDWLTFGAFAVELYNGSEGCARATVRFEDGAGAVYEEVFYLPPRGWRAARLELAEARERYYLKAAGSGDGLRFETKPRLELSSVTNVEIAFETPAGGEVRVGRAWLEARKD
jgi:hypothetical protein